MNGSPRPEFVGPDAAAAATQTARLSELLAPHEHIYLSTACWHAEHDRRPELHAYCQGTEREDGSTKTPAVCKWCPSPCTCYCHTTQTC